MKKIKFKLSAALAALLACVSIVTTVTAPPAQASVLHWAHLTWVSRVVADNNPFYPQRNVDHFRWVRARASYRCQGPGVPYASVGIHIYRPRTNTSYGRSGWLAYCDGTVHTTPWVAMAGDRDLAFAAGERVTVHVIFSASGGWRSNYASMPSTVKLGVVTSPS
jgi:hypothetical protein